MEKENLIQTISDVRKAWETAIAELGSEGLEQPGASGDLRVRDVLAIFIGWDRYNLVQLRCAFTGEIPANDELTGGIPYPPRDTFSIDAMNAMFIAGSRELPVQEIVRHWREISDMRADWVSAASQKRILTKLSVRTGAVIIQEQCGLPQRYPRSAILCPPGS